METDNLANYRPIAILGSIARARSCTMYAGDTSASNSLKPCRDIEENVIPSLINTCDWLNANKLSLNTIKTKFMLIGSAHNNKKFDNLLAIRLGNELIRRTHLTKYLGLIVDDKLK